jgi:hypothetical protein
VSAPDLEVVVQDPDELLVSVEPVSGDLGELETVVQDPDELLVSVEEVA